MIILARVLPAFATFAVGVNLVAAFVNFLHGNLMSAGVSAGLAAVVAGATVLAEYSRRVLAARLAFEETSRAVMEQQRMIAEKFAASMRTLEVDEPARRAH